MKIEQVRALVTGGSSGIGLEIAKQLIARGARVAICARDAARLERAASEIGATAIAADVAVEPTSPGRSRRRCASSTVTTR